MTRQAIIHVVNGDHHSVHAYRSATFEYSRGHEHDYESSLISAPLPSMVIRTDGRSEVASGPTLGIAAAKTIAFLSSKVEHLELEAAKAGDSYQRGRRDAFNEMISSLEELSPGLIVSAAESLEDLAEDLQEAP